MNTLPDATIPEMPAEAAPKVRPGPNPHPRDEAVEAAGRELVDFLSGLIDRHSLTAWEYLYLLAVPTHKQIQAFCVQERDHVAKGPK